MKQLCCLILMTSFLSRLFGGESTASYETADVYRSLRQQVFDLRKENFNELEPIAILLETGMADGCYTLVAVSDGSTSLYFSNGGGIIGAGQHPKGADASKAFLVFARNFEDQLKKTEEYPLPQPGMTRFYIVRKDSVLTGEFKEDDLGNGKVPLSPLFHKGHELITTIRLIEEKRKE
jgi:hypothetical protein